jgi:large subunit ribosomal protein L30
MSGKTRIRATLIKSSIGAKRDHRACVRGLGLKRLNQTVELDNTPEVRGMINRVGYLLKWEAM